MPKINLEKLKTVDATYNWDNFFEYERGMQAYWQAIRNKHIINLDTLHSSHVTLFLERMTDFFTGLESITIRFQSSKGRLGKVRIIAKQMRLKYKKLGKIGNTIHVGQIKE